jgi:hypothetical protein
MLRTLVWKISKFSKSEHEGGVKTASLPIIIGFEISYDDNYKQFFFYLVGKLMFSDVTSFGKSAINLFLFPR